ncbi:LuxR C-terminal-related transcriptional regulator [Dyadobacter sp. CY261]|uniref:LuxR C-terminal-related transcriptional regulator n=1 Tax=Dyadobacter sp. CY261 TaxID=2907203 RepID=UPI001F24E9F9|nr:LuxR C-terminal-related transcriptional regulator [Dyadobacter sp. CY261]MCF0071258.1 LuxR C-terminal-related transcriptional regulator [Dyadobacter sp. CY261]
MRGNTDLSLQSLPGRSMRSSPDYLQLLNTYYDFDGVEPDRLDKQLALVRAMAQLSSSGVTVYDLQKQVHVYASRNFYQLYGYNFEDWQSQVENEVFDRKIHPDDRDALARNGYGAMKFMMQQSVHTRKHFKLVTEYRILTDEQAYVRVSEQHQVLELDASGNIWLSLGVIDISPNQKLTEVSMQINNFHTGELIKLENNCISERVKLTAREKEILGMVGSGKLSKEISALLDISVHTVNTHRQRILEKLRADNSIEALQSAKLIGLIA